MVSAIFVAASYLVRCLETCHLLVPVREEPLSVWCCEVEIGELFVRAKNSHCQKHDRAEILLFVVAVGLTLSSVIVFVREVVGRLATGSLMNLVYAIVSSLLRD